MYKRQDGDGTADRAGLVAQITDSGFAAMEGDAEDAVRLLTYGADDPGILGYINLPEGPKEFTLTAQTENGITVTITGGKVTNVAIDASGETPDLGGKAAEALSASLLAAGSTVGVDAVSGSTMTSDAVFAAMNDCLAQAAQG